jgi:hypothetical protein
MFIFILNDPNPKGEPCFLRAVFEKETLPLCSLHAVIIVAVLRAENQCSILGRRTMPTGPMGCPDSYPVGTENTFPSHKA